MTLRDPTAGPSIARRRVGAVGTWLGRHRWLATAAGGALAVGGLLWLGRLVAVWWPGWPPANLLGKMLDRGAQIAAVIGAVGVIVVWMAWRHPVAPAVLAALRRWRLVPASKCRPEWVGVHPAVARPGTTATDDSNRDFPEYVSRDHDDELHRRLRAAATSGGFVVLLGGSSVGKTRSLYEAIRKVLPSWQVLLAADANAVRDATDVLPPNTIVWLDDTPVEKYLAEAGHGGLTRADLLKLINRDAGPIVVVDILWSGRYQQLTATPTGHPFPQVDQYRDARDVLALAYPPIEIRSQFSPTERSRATALVNEDPRLAAALEDTQFGFTQFLAGAPELIDRWRRAEPYSHAVITAAIDVCRLGVRTPLAADLLKDAAAGYLGDRQRAAAPPDWFTTALTYATDHGKGATAPLLPQPGNGDTVGVIAGYSVADFLLQPEQHHRGLAPTPPAAWEALARHTTDATDLTRLGTSAYERMLYRHAELFYRHAMAAGATDIPPQLADLLAGQAREQGLRDLADDGYFYARERLADLLIRQDRIDEAIDELRVLATTGDTDARLLRELEGNIRASEELWSYLASQGRERELPKLATARHARERLVALLAEQGRERELRELLVPGAGMSARLRLADLLVERDRIGEAIDELRKATNLTAPGAAPAAPRVVAAVSQRLGALLVEQSSEQQLRDLAAAGDAPAFHVLVKRLVKQDRIDEALGELQRRQATTDDVSVPDKLIDRLAEQDREQNLRDLAAGDTYAFHVLVDRLVEQDRIDEALGELQRRQATTTDDVSVPDKLIDRLAEQSSEQQLRILAAACDAYAFHVLVERLVEQDRIDEALGEVQRRQATTDDVSVPDKLIDQLAEQDREQDLRDLADAGYHAASDRLVDLLATQGPSNEVDRAIDQLRERVIGGDFSALPRWVDLLAKQAYVDQVDEIISETWKLVTGGVFGAREPLADVLAAQGREQQLRELAATDFDARWRLVDLLYAQGREQELREIADAGDYRARERLVDLLFAQGGEQELREIADAGDYRARERLVDLLAAQGRDQQLRELTLGGLTKGSMNAGQRLVALLAAQGRESEVSHFNRCGLNPDGSTAAEYWE